MESNLKLGLIFIGLLLVITVFIIMRRGRMPIKFALVWLFPSVIILVLAIFPTFFTFFADIFGFQTISNLVVGMLFILLIFIIMALTVLIAGQTTKITLLIQEMSLLKERVRTYEEYVEQNKSDY